MDEKKLKALAAELAKGLKTEADLNAFSRMLTKLTVETALNAELTDHLGHEKNAPKSGSNTRNGYLSKTLFCKKSSNTLASRHFLKRRCATFYAPASMEPFNPRFHWRSAIFLHYDFF